MVLVVVASVKCSTQEGALGGQQVGSVQGLRNPRLQRRDSTLSSNKSCRDGKCEPIVLLASPPCGASVNAAGTPLVFSKLRVSSTAVAICLIHSGTAVPALPLLPGNSEIGLWPPQQPCHYHQIREQ